MLKMIAMGLAVTSAQSYNFDLDTSGFDDLLENINLAFLEHGDICATDSTCKSFCCSRNLKLSTTPYLNYNYFNTTFSYS